MRAHPIASSRGHSDLVVAAQLVSGSFFGNLLEKLETLFLTDGRILNPLHKHVELVLKRDQCG